MFFLYGFLVRVLAIAILAVLGVYFVFPEFFAQLLAYSQNWLIDQFVPDSLQWLI